MQRQHGLDRPCAVDEVPIMPCNFIPDEDECQQPADCSFCPIRCVSEADEDQVEEDERADGGEVRISK